MGTLYYVVNHTKKEYISICKLGEFYLNQIRMIAIYETIIYRWNNHKIGILDEYQIEKYWDLGYTEFKINWNDYNDYVE